MACVESTCAGKNPTPILHAAVMLESGLVADGFVTLELAPLATLHVRMIGHMCLHTLVVSLTQVLLLAGSNYI